MRLIILGCSGVYPGPGKACAGYLVMEGDTRLLLDCGIGVLANLQKHIAIKELTGIIISHMHPDHFFDLVPLRYALLYGRLNVQAKLPVYLPPGGYEIWKSVVAAFDETKGAFSAPFTLSEYAEQKVYQIGCFKVRLSEIHHYMPNYGVEVSNTSRLVYSGDAGPGPELVKWAQRADLFLCEATSLKDKTKAENRGHLTAKEAGAVAREAGVRQLVLTHLMPGVDSEKILSDAKLSFGEKVSLAEEGQTYIVPEG